MAASFESETIKRTSTLWADYPENFKLDPELNGRIESTDISDLVADIEANGQYQPILIRKDEDGEAVIVYGHRRWRAVMEINKKRARRGEEPLKLEARYESKMSDEDAFKAAIAENRFRKDASPMDDNHNIEIWTKRFKKSVEEIAAIYFPEARTTDAKASAIKWVKDRIALTELAPEAQQAVRDGRMKITAAVQLSRMSKAKQREVVAKKNGNVRGKERIRVSNVLAAKTPAAPKPVATGTVYEAAEEMSKAIEAWVRNEKGAEKAILVAQKKYRALVPLPKAEKDKNTLMMAIAETHARREEK